MFKWPLLFKFSFLFLALSIPLIAQQNFMTFKLGSTDSLTEKVYRIRGINKVLQKLSSENMSIDGRKLLLERKSLIAGVAAVSPELIKELQIPAGVQLSAIGNLEGMVETQVAEIRGTVCTVEYDYKEGEPRREYFLTNKSGMYQLKNRDDLPLNIKGNDSLVIRNSTQLNNIILFSGSDLKIENSLSIDPNVGDIKVLVFLENYSDPSRGDLLSPQLFTTLMTDPNSVIQKWLKENSFGKARVSDVAVVGWINIDATWQNYSETDSEFRKKFIGTNIDPSRYDYFIRIENSRSFYQYSGLSFVGSIQSNWSITKPYIRVSYINYDRWSTDNIVNYQIIQPYSTTILHEIGHCFGFGHASTYTLTNDVLKIAAEYGDEFCIMGSSLSGHYKGYFKEAIGWIDSTGILTITGSGTYAIKNYEALTGRKLAKVRTGNPDQPKYLYLEYRNSSGYDIVYLNKTGMPYTKGLLLSANYNYFGDYVGPFAYRLNEGPDFGHSYIIDTKSVFGTKTTPILSGTSAFIDAKKGIQVGPVLSFTDSTITFTVNYSSNVLGTPALLLPRNNTAGLMTSPNILYFSWTAVPGAVNYQIQFSQISADFTTPLYTTTVNRNEAFISYTAIQSQNYGVRWRVRAIDATSSNGDWSNPFQYIYTTTANGQEDKIPVSYSLSQNYPNPFNPATTIKYSIAYSETPYMASLQHVTLRVYDLLGRVIATLVDEEKSPGNYQVEFNGRNLSSGTYIYRLNAGLFSQARKFILLK